MHALLVVFSFLLLPMAMAARAETTTLTAAAVEWLPYQMVSDSEVRGIVPDMLRDIAAITGIRIEFRPEPVKRMLADFREGTVTLDPMSNPLWRQEDAAISVYSEPYMDVHDVILMRKENAIKATDAGDFRGMTMGCELGYVYADGFDDAFNHGVIQRQDVASGAQANLMRLQAGRVDAIIINELASNYWMRELGLKTSDYQMVYHFSDYSELRLRLHISQSAALPAINKAIKQLKKEGRLKDYVNHYVSGPSAFIPHHQ